MQPRNMARLQQRWFKEEECSILYAGRISLIEVSAWENWMCAGSGLGVAEASLIAVVMRNLAAIAALTRLSMCVCVLDPAPWWC